MSWLYLRSLFGALDQWDVFTDLLFPLTTRACDAHLTPAWLTSWEQAWLG